MKIWITCLFLLTFSVKGNTVFGQVHKNQIGIEAGPGIISLIGNTNSEKNFKPNKGFSGGLFFQTRLSKIISLRSGLSYERKGAAVKYNPVHNQNETRMKSRTNFDYLTLPIHVRASFGKKVHFFANAGPYFGYLINQYFKSGGSELALIHNNTGAFNRFDFGLSGGLGFSWPVHPNLNISFEARKNIGLYDIDKGNDQIKTNSTQFLLGPGFRLGSITK